MFHSDVLWGWTEQKKDAPPLCCDVFPGLVNKKGAKSYITTVILKVTVGQYGHTVSHISILPYLPQKISSVKDLCCLKRQARLTQRDSSESTHTHHYDWNAIPSVQYLCCLACQRAVSHTGWNKPFRRPCLSILWWKQITIVKYETSLFFIYLFLWIIIFDCHWLCLLWICGKCSASAQGRLGFDQILWVNK